MKKKLGESTQNIEDAALRRLLATPPQPKLKKEVSANPPKKRGRPPKVSPLTNDGDA